MGVTRKPAATPRKKAPAKRTPSTTTSRKKKLVETKRKKKLRLTVQEIRLLEFPPTETTWICKCGAINNGADKVCWIDRQPKGRKPKLLYPIYAAACKKVGIEEGMLWRIQDKMADRVLTRAPKGSWRVIELPEGFTL